MDGIFPMLFFTQVFAHSGSLHYFSPLITFTHFCSLTNVSLLTYFIIRILSIPQGWAQNPITSLHYPSSSSQGFLCSLNDYREYLFHLSSMCLILYLTWHCQLPCIFCLNYLVYSGQSIQEYIGQTVCFLSCLLFLLYLSHNRLLIFVYIKYPII